jgi:hypothetical protein
MTDPAPARKPSRWGLFLPFILLALAALAWSAAWFWLSRQTTEQLDAAAEQLRRGGYALSWERRSVSGYPFRLNLQLTGARFATPAGRSLSAPRLEAQAAAYRPDRWVFNLPEGFTFERPLVGPTKVTGRVIRGSVTATERLPRINAEGRELVFTPAGGPLLFPLASAGRVDIALQSRPSGADEAGVLLRVQDAVAAQGTLLQRIGGDPKGRLVWEAVLTEASALRGRDWGDLVRSWSDAGGVMQVAQGDAAVGAAAARVESGRLRVGADGRLRGELTLAVRRGPSALLQLRGAPRISPEAATAAAAVAEARQQNETARLPLVFEAGVVTVGPVALAPAPKIY